MDACQAEWLEGHLHPLCLLYQDGTTSLAEGFGGSRGEAQRPRRTDTFQNPEQRRVIASTLVHALPRLSFWGGWQGVAFQVVLPYSDGYGCESCVSSGEGPRQKGSFLAKSQCGGRERGIALASDCKPRFAGFAVCTPPPSATHHEPAHGLKRRRVFISILQCRLRPATRFNPFSSGLLFFGKHK